MIFCLGKSKLDRGDIKKKIEVIVRVVIGSIEIIYFDKML